MIVIVVFLNEGQVNKRCTIKNIGYHHGTRGIAMDWHEKWKEGDTPWDLEAPHPGALETAQWINKQHLNQDQNSVFLPLCGSAHDAQPFLKISMEVDGCDISPAAIKKAKKVNAEFDRFHGIAGDFYSLSGREKSYHLIFDRAALCAMEPSTHAAYIEQIASLLNAENAIYAVVVFDEIDARVEGPPFAISALEFFKLVQPHFYLVEARKLTVPAKTPAILKETLYLLSKK